jgi:hypothetical protein
MDLPQVRVAEVMYDIPNMAAVQKQVHLAVLGDLEHGDVFYLTDTPYRVWWFDAAVKEFSFTCLGSEVWCAQDEIGDPKQRVVVLHNTRQAIREKVAALRQEC